ncbi:NAD-dependent epimerase/dehydratase family protein [Candidatus Omnitrophota bacterium]
MKAVVFGGSGFLGSHVSDALLEKGYEVVIYDRVKSPYLYKGQKMVVGDILDHEKIMKVIDRGDVIYNFAGVADLDEAKVNPVETIKQNVLGNSLILDVCARQKVKRFMYASSVYVYSDRGAFYNTSKRACESIIEDYRKTYGLDFTILRYGSLYGPRSDERNTIYRMLKQSLTEKKISREGDGEEIREYVHVRDAATISVEMLDDQYINQHLIITGNQGIKIKDLLVLISEILKNDIKIEYLPVREEVHYEITPYSFNPKVAKKVISSSYFDLGQGLLDMMDRIHKETVM